MLSVLTSIHNMVIIQQLLLHLPCSKANNIGTEDHNLSANTGSELVRRSLAKVIDRVGDDDVTTINKSMSRSKRFDYEDHHEWPDDDNMDYDLDGEEDEDDLSLVDRIVKHWQTVVVRGVFYMVGACMLLLISCCCCKVCCRVCCHSLRQNCVPCGGFLQLISAYYEDPMYRKAKDMAEMFGLKLDYDTFLKIKERYDMGSEGPYNPLGLPHMA